MEKCECLLYTVGCADALGLNWLFLRKFNRSSASVHVEPVTTLETALSGQLLRAEQMINGPCAATSLVGLTGKPATRWWCSTDGGQKGRVSSPAKQSVENTHPFITVDLARGQTCRVVNKRPLKPRPVGANRPHQQVNGFFFLNPL